MQTVLPELSAMGGSPWLRQGCRWGCSYREQGVKCLREAGIFCQIPVQVLSSLPLSPRIHLPAGSPVISFAQKGTENTNLPIYVKKVL